jgi:transcriptional regulator with XRE-family HTH domain
MQTKKSLNLNLINQKLFEFGLNQSKISEKLGVSREAVSKWFKAENLPSAGLLLKLSKLLKLTFDEILKMEYINQPIISYRKNANAKTTDEDIDFALGMGLILDKLAQYFPLDSTYKPSFLQHPQNDYEYINNIVQDIRNDIKLDNEILTFKDIISIYYKNNSVVIPVLWGNNKRHANALRVYIPDSMTTWVYLNMNTNIYDFKFIMAHELGHIIAIDLIGKEAESFSDNFAGALLFPKNHVSNLYERIMNESSERQRIHLIIEEGKKLKTSPLSIYYQLTEYFKYYQKPDINVKHLIFQFNTKFKSYFSTVAMKVFNTENPSAEKYVNYVNKYFEPPFFKYLKKYIEENELSSTFIQNLLDIPYLDAQNIYHAL